MKRSNRLVLLVGIFLALIAFMLIAFSGVVSPKSAGPSAAPTTTKVVVAARNVALGATFAEADVTLKVIPLPAPVDSYSDTSYVVGKIVRATVTAGQLIDSVVINGGGNIDNIEVPGGRVAMSVKVDQLSGVGTVIKPGDYVDAMVAFNIKPLTIDPTTGDPKALDVDTGPSVKVLLQGLQVLGTLLPTPPPAAAPAEGATPAPSAGTNLNGQEQIVILSVSAQQAEVLNYSQITGVVTPNGISLLLRSAKDFVGPDGQPSFPPDTITTGIVLKLLVDQYGVLPPSFQVTALPGSSPRPSSSSRPSPSPSPSPGPSPTP